MYHQSKFSRREHLLWRPHCSLELVVAIIIVVAVIATIAIFLGVYHDVPFRSGEPT